MTQTSAKSIRDLAGRIVWVATNTSTYSYPRFGKNLAEAWDELRSDIDNLRPRLGDLRANVLLEMCSRAQAHFATTYNQSPTRPASPGEPGFDELKLGSRLMQDLEWVTRGREPFAYPRELYSWPRIASSRATGDPDME